MEYKTEIKVTKDALNDPRLNDEFFARKLIMKLLMDVPLEKLTAICLFKKTDPFSRESIDKLKDSNIPFEERHRLTTLQRECTIMYEVKIDL